MLPKVTNPQITTETDTIQINGDAHLFVKILRGAPRSGRTAIYIHGGGGGGNHTIVERPSRHLINEGFFDTVILPDRRGDGASSPLTGKHTIMDHSADMHSLLDRLEISGPLTALGVSYGGPIALGLACVDTRVERVVLVASSPALSENNGVARFLVQSGLLRPIMKLSYKANLGKLPPAQVDFDPAYESHRPTDLMRLFAEGLKRTPRDQMDSLLYSLEATLDTATSSLPEEVRLEIPVIQIIGESDEVWGSRLLEEYLTRFPHFRQYRVQGAKIHKDVLLKPGLFQKKLHEALATEFNQ